MNTFDGLIDAKELAAIDEVIQSFLARRLSDSASISEYYQELWLEIARMFNSGGKRLRPQITLLAYRIFGGKEPESILPAAAAQELLNLGMLVHDDIIDLDYVRYGVDNIAGIYLNKYDKFVPNNNDKLHFAHSAALLAGDLLLSEAHLMLAESKVSANKILEVQKLFGQGIFEVTGGELLDTESTFRNSGAINPELVARYKTASYTFITPMLIGFQLADGAISNQKHIINLGSFLGIAYQLRDDILGVFGDSSITGKSNSSDIITGKQTLMVSQFNNLADKQQKHTFDSLFGVGPISEKDLDCVRNLLIKTGALEYTEQKIDEYVLLANAESNKLNIEPEHKDLVDKLIKVTTKRKK
ncbi:MAG: polyprenyl synthetase family protein [bacterium]|nr:polyprenyl synthetase family protein [bacterium]